MSLTRIVLIIVAGCVCLCHGARVWSADSTGHTQSVILLESAFEPYSQIDPEIVGYTPISTVDMACLESYGHYEISLFNPRCGEDGERLWSQTKLMFGMGFGIAELSG